MGTGGEYLDLLDPNDEIFWKEAGLYIPDDALRDKFGQGGSNVPGGIDSSRRYQGGLFSLGNSCRWNRMSREIYWRLLMTLKQLI